MQANRMLGILKVREMRLLTKRMTAKREKLSLRTKFNYSLSENICNALWILHLLKTSVLVTRTPLTTFKCMCKAVAS
jgi:hypothetical protein